MTDAIPPTGAPSPGLGGAFLRALRPRQWTKNGAVLAAVVFAGRAGDRAALEAAVGGAALFCLASGACYILNDLVDRERDRAHPRKRERPIASGALPAGVALVGAVALLATAFGLGIGLLPPLFACLLAVYVANTLAYTLALKRVPLLDVMAIAAGFVLRAVAGGAAIRVAVSPWLLLCTAFLALFLGFAKRRQEVVLDASLAAGGATRESLAGYSVPLLDSLLMVTTACTIMSYCLYTFLAGRDPWLMATVPFVLFGVFRYLALTLQGGAGETPEQTLLEDRSLQVTIAGWIAACGAVLYGA